MHISAKSKAPAPKNIIEMEISLIQQLYEGFLPSPQNGCNKVKKVFKRCTISSVYRERKNHSKGLIRG